MKVGSKIYIDSKETTVLFEDKFDLKQKEDIETLLRILGQYMFVDMFILLKRASQKIRINYIKKAVEWTLVTELIMRDDSNNKIFYYKLLPAGEYRLRSFNRIPIINRIPSEYTQAGLERLLWINYILLDKGYTMAPQKVSYNLSYFIGNDATKNKYVFYYPTIIAEKQVVKRILSSCYPHDDDAAEVTPETVYADYKFIPVTDPNMRLNEKIHGSHVSELVDPDEKTFINPYSRLGSK